MYRSIACLLCLTMFCLAISPRQALAVQSKIDAGLNDARILEKYPNAKIIRIDPEDYPGVQQKLRRSGYRQVGYESLQLALADPRAGSLAGDATPARSKQQQDCAGEADESASEHSINVLVDFTEDMLENSHSSSDDAAIVFIIIGTIVLVVWTLYVFKYIYDVSVGMVPCERWHELTAVASSASVAGGQHLQFDGLRYATGFRDGATDVGISLEIGRADILLQETGVLALQGNYWLAGPVLRWRLSQSGNPVRFQLDFTAGTTEHDEVGLIARARMMLSLGVGESIRLGLGWGAMNLNLDEDQGIISDHSQYHYLYAVTAGVRF